MQKLTILYIEDEVDFRDRLAARLMSRFTIAPLEVQDFSTVPEQGEAADQFERWLLSHIGDPKQLHGVILDSDLSGYRNGIAKETLLAVFRTLGIPVCRYSKRPKSSSSEILKHLATLASEGASSVLVPGGLVSDGFADDDELANWLVAAFAGFEAIREAYAALVTGGEKVGAPPAVLARLLAHPSAELDFQGYTGASLFFFADRLVGADETKNFATDDLYIRNTATKLAYWLFNYVMAFPGPILTTPAAAALLGIRSDDLNGAEFERALNETRYQGPFSGCQSLFWRDALDGLLECGAAGVSILKERGFEAVPLHEAEPERSGALCIVTNRSLPLESCIGPLDWIPSGASDLCRVDRKIYARLTPWLNL